MSPADMPAPAAEPPLVDQLYAAYTGAHDVAALTAAAAGFEAELEAVLAEAIRAGTLYLEEGEPTPATAAGVAALAGWERLLAAAALLMMPPGRGCCLYRAAFEALAAGGQTPPSMLVPLGAVGTNCLDFTYIPGAWLPPSFEAYESVTLRVTRGPADDVLATINATARFARLNLVAYGRAVDVVPPVGSLCLVGCRPGEVATPRAKLILEDVEGGEALLRAAFDAGLEITISSVEPRAVEVRGAVPSLCLIGRLRVSGACRADALKLIGCELAPNARLTAGRALIGWFGGGGLVTAGRVEFADGAGGVWATLAAPGAAAPAGGWPGDRPRIVSGVFTGLREASAVVGRLASASYGVVDGLARDSPRVESDEVAFWGRAAPGAARGRPTTVWSLRDANGAGAAVVRARCLAGGRAGDYAALVLSFERAGWREAPAGDVRAGLLVVRASGQDAADAVAGLRDLPNGRRVAAARVMLVDLAGRRVDGAALAAAVGGRPAEEAAGVPAGWLTGDVDI